MAMMMLLPMIEAMVDMMLLIYLQALQIRMLFLQVLL
jgi:hypothetical protein